jgi:hypothetical protein
VSKITGFSRGKVDANFADFRQFSLPKARAKPRCQPRRLAVKRACCLGTRGVQPANRRRNLTSLKAVWDDRKWIAIFDWPDATAASGYGTTAR